VDLAGCLVRIDALACAPTLAALEGAVAAAELDYFELAGRACVDALGARPCGEGWRLDLLAVPACADAFSPRVEPGGTCSSVVSCAGDAACAGATCPGACVARAGINAPCDVGQPCADGLYCGLPSRRCLAAVDRGSPCALSLSGNPCEPGSWCDATMPANPVCRAAKGRGEGCVRDEECAGGARCLRNRCAAGLAGDGCLADDDCGAILACAGGRCVEPLAPDVACAEAGPPCAEGLACTSSAGASLCRPRLLPGAPCGPGAACDLGRCEAGRCVRAAADGEACADAAACLPGRLCTSGRCAPPARACTR
jgi:hypothetical protein